MNTQTQLEASQIQPLPAYGSILLAVDSSDHSNRAITEALGLAEIWSSRLSAAHVYAAKLHDRRFRQMEGGLPEQYREEQELERQRDVHDDLITKGLNIITESYLDQVERESSKKEIKVTRRSLEGKNYREMVNEANSGNYDLLIMGALGLGAIKNSRLGTVCSRVARRSEIDTLVIKQPTRTISAGPIVVAVDGSTKSYGGLLTALALAQKWQVPVKVISAFDPYYHYVAFNRIAGVLSEEAGKVFRFQEQEQLHEEIIDSGLAKIYQGHLAVSQQIAADHDIEIETALLDGKPHDVINKYLRQVNPSLLVIGTTGIHTDAGLDIGGNTEALLHDADCAVLMSQREYQPQVDRLASVSTSWTKEAEARMERVPSFVRNMARMAILRYAQEHGHTVITESIVDEATAKLMPGHAEDAMAEIVDAYDKGELRRKPSAEDAMRWSEDATRLLLTVKDLSLRGNLSMRAEKKARVSDSRTVELAHIKPFIDDDVETGEFNPSTEALETHKSAVGREQRSEEPQPSVHWQAAALARLMRVPEGFMRDTSKERIENYARAEGHSEVTLEIAEAGLAQARAAMTAQMSGDTAESDTPKRSGCPFAKAAAPKEEEQPANIAWDQEAKAMLQNVPAGFCRDMTAKAAETMAQKEGHAEVTPAFIGQVMQTFMSGSITAKETMPWDDDARDRILRAPDMVRGMLIQEIESWTQRQGMKRVTIAAVDAVKKTWQERGVFHLDPEDPRNTSA